MALPDTADVDTYGGLKVNHAPVVDSSKQEAADDRNKYVADVAAMTHTLVRAMCTFDPGATVADPATNIHDAVWGSSAPYKPTPSRSSAGVYVVTWPTTTTDAIGATHTTNIRRCLVNVEGTTAIFATATPTTANTVTVRLFDAAGAATDGAAGTLITVYVV